MIGDGDTGFGSAQNIKRTVQGYARAGFAAIMLEDQVAPKRCGHTEGKSVVGRDEALTRIRAAVDARDDGADILIMARTDARACVSLDEAIARCRLFREIGADITFLEAPLGRRGDAALLRGSRRPEDGQPDRRRQDADPAAAPARGDRLHDCGLSADAAERLDLRDARSAAQPARRVNGPAAMDFEELKQAVGFPGVLRRRGALQGLALSLLLWLPRSSLRNWLFTSSARRQRASGTFFREAARDAEERSGDCSIRWPLGSAELRARRSTSPESQPPLLTSSRADRHRSRLSLQKAPGRRICRRAWSVFERSGAGETNPYVGQADSNGLTAREG